MILALAHWTVSVDPKDVTPDRRMRLLIGRGPDITYSNW